MTAFLKDLRRAYPHMPIQVFAELYEKHRDDDSLLEVLDEAEKKAVLAKEEAERKLRELGALLSVSEQHHLLKFMVPADIDLEHAQAILMYGFLLPGKGTAFIGDKMIEEAHVRTNVERKFGVRFSLLKYDAALQYLKQNKLFNRKTDRGEALSLKSSWTEKGTSTHGAQILRVALEFAHKKLGKR